MIYEYTFFPTCQVRVVRFYQSCSPPPTPPPRLAVLLLLVLLLRLLLQFLLHHLCLHFHVHFPLPTLRQALCQLPSSVCTAGPQPASCSSVCTAGPQPGTCPAQCAPLDLNLGPAQLSVHRWTSTWDLLSSVCTAGPQRPDRMPEDMPEDMPDRMPEDMPEDMPGRMPEDMPDRMPEGMPDRMPVKMSDRMPEDLPVTKCINVMVRITRSKVICFFFPRSLPRNLRPPQRVGLACFAAPGEENGERRILWEWNQKRASVL